MISGFIRVVRGCYFSVLLIPFLSAIWTRRSLTISWKTSSSSATALSKEQRSCTRKEASPGGSTGLRSSIPLVFVAVCSRSYRGLFSVLILIVVI